MSYVRFMYADFEADLKYRLMRTNGGSIKKEIDGLRIYKLKDIEFTLAYDVLTQSYDHDRNDVIGIRHNYDTITVISTSLTFTWHNEIKRWTIEYND